jgi:hypothetical protein
MQRKYVKASAALMALYCQWTGFMLHRKVIPYRARAIANEIECRGKPFLLEKFVEKIIESALSRVDLSGWGDRRDVSANKP